MGSEMCIRDSWETFPEGVDNYPDFIGKAIDSIDKGLA